jgi:RNA polymerase sigma factor (sigma-70 family)
MMGVVAPIGDPGDDFDATLDAARDGSQAALRALHDDVATRVHRYLVAHGVRDAEDEANEVLLRALTRLDRFTGGRAEFRTWVLTIAHHRMVDSHRRTSRRVEEHHVEVEATGGDVEDEAMAVLGDAHVAALLDRLPHDQREVLVLRISADLSVEQAAAVLGRTTGATKALQRRALAALRRSLGHERVPR